MHRAAAVAVLLAVAGCAAEEPPRAGPEPVPPVCAQPSGTGAAALPPVFVRPGDTAVAADVGRGLFFEDGMDLTLTVDDPSVVRVSQPSDDGTMQLTAGGQVLAPGRATITARPRSGPARTIVVTASCPTPR